ncbi:SMI1/KNR4 family protein [Tumebacillus sp. DT12]|uniref:SMI1/KNR4 family protein n=1 Tax=Tumebacillus lacus TaxID=2995335 RepID=A0ABT3X3Y0_9BACL|nr:SMI1/KNR4 family protein [Tumebacillus lacus]MCX7570532.1 SMI1/KNR4 family protein [Tumebacillus lacus]
MSLDTYLEAKAKILTNKEKGFFIGPRSDELIAFAQEATGLKFSGTYLDFLKSFGAGNFGAQEIYGIIGDDFENSSVPDAIWYTLTERREIKLPNHLLVIYDSGNGELLCLDFNHPHEPTVVQFFPGIDVDQQTFAVVASDFGDFLLDLVNQEL